MTSISVDTSDLKKAIEEARNLPYSDMTKAIGEGITTFKDRLRGSGRAPGDVWPIGTVKKSASGKKYYVKAGTAGSRRSGRSLRGWKSRQDGLSAVVFNDARSSSGGTLYARHVHRADQPATRSGDLGAAAQEASEIFEEVFAEVAVEMTEFIMDVVG